MTGPLQSLRQASIRTRTGKAQPFNGDWHDLFDRNGIAPGPYDGRLLRWCNLQMGTSYTDVSGAKTAYAKYLGWDRWGSIKSIEDTRVWGFLASDLPQTVENKRTGTKWYFGADGILRESAAGGSPLEYRYLNGSWVRDGRSRWLDRTNVCLQSEDLTTTWIKVRSTITPNNILAPTGLQTADKLVEDTSGSTHYASQNITLTGSTDYVYSFFARANQRTWVALETIIGGAARIAYFDIANGVLGNTSGWPEAWIDYCGNGWYRCAARFNSGTDTANYLRVRLALGDLNSAYTGDGSSGAHIWGLQAEVGNFPSNYIPTTTAVVTRTMDDYVDTDVSYLGAEHTMYAEHRPFNVGEYGSAMSIDDGTTANRMDIAVSSIERSRGSVATGNVSQMDLQTAQGAVQQGAFTKQAMRIATNNGAMFHNGTQTGADDTSLTVPTGHIQTKFGSRAAGGGSTQYEGMLHRNQYWPEGKDNAFLGSITAPTPGPELLDDPEFNNPAAWAIDGSEWTVSGGKATYVGTSEGYIEPVDAVALSAGQLYEAKLTFSGIATTAMYSLFNDNETENYLGGFEIIGADGDYTHQFTPAANSTNIRLVGAFGGANGWAVERFSLRAIG